MDSSDDYVERGLSVSDSEWECARFPIEIISPLVKLKMVKNYWASHEP